MTYQHRSFKEQAIHKGSAPSLWHVMEPAFDPSDNPHYLHYPRQTHSRAERVRFAHSFGEFGGECLQALPNYGWPRTNVAIISVCQELFNRVATEWCAREYDGFEWYVRIVRYCKVPPYLASIFENLIYSPPTPANTALAIEMGLFLQKRLTQEEWDLLVVMRGAANWIEESNLKSFYGEGQLVGVWKFKGKPDGFPVDFQKEVASVTTTRQQLEEEPAAVTEPEPSENTQPESIESDDESSQKSASTTNEAVTPKESRKKSMEISFQVVKERLLKAKVGDSVDVEWTDKSTPRCWWKGVLTKKAARGGWSVKFDVDSDFVDTMIPNETVTYFDVVLHPQQEQQQQLPQQHIKLPRAGLVAFRFYRAGSTWHFGRVKGDSLIAQRRVFDGFVVPMGDKIVPLGEVAEISTLAEYPVLGQRWPRPDTRPQPAVQVSASRPANAAAIQSTPVVRSPLQQTRALVGSTVPAVPEGQDEFEALLEFSHGDLLAGRVQIDPQPSANFQLRHLSAPQVADLKGGFLRSLVLVPHDVKMLPHKALAKSTVVAHKRMLKQLAQLPGDLIDKDLDEALVSLFTRARNSKRLRWSTLVTKMATAHGALRLLPLYTTTKFSVMLKESVIWMQALKGASKEAKQEVPNQATPATWEKVLSAVQQEGQRPIRMAVLLTWLTCGRGGDVLLLKPDCVEVQEMGLMVHFRRGKTVKTRGPYSVFTPLPPEPLNKEFLDYLEVTKADRRNWLFEKVQGAMIKLALRRADPKLEQRSLRRGAIQTLAATGLNDEELLKYSGHTNVQMLRRYLNFGKLSGEGRRLQAQATALLRNNPVGQL